MHRKSLTLLLVLSLCCSVNFVDCNGRQPGDKKTKAALVPGERWLRYANPEDAGFSGEKLETARQFWDSTQSAACMIVHRGAVVAAWGDVERRFMCHSVRKSLLSALYGVYVDAGAIDLEKTLEEMGIDDRTPLTQQEKRARIVDLLTSSSGVYLPAASEGANARKPARGSHEPGTYMFYNNWDFNALGTIFETATQKNLFEEFKIRIADPLHMEDLRARDMYYSYQPEQSMHPAYIFRMSTRDLARFGLLYLNEGRWDDSRILSESWVKRSTSRQIDANRSMGYGYLWWVYKDKPLAKMKMYAALGDGEQALDIVPSEDLLIVTRTNTYEHKEVSSRERLNLVRLILEAKRRKPSKDPQLLPLAGQAPAVDTVAITKAERAFLCAEPAVRTENAIYEDGEDVILKTPYGTFGVMKTGSGTWIMEDKEQEIIIERTAGNTLERIDTEWSLNDEGKRHLDAGRLDEAIAAFVHATECFPNSIIGFCNLGEAYLKNNMRDKALKSYERAGQIDPENREVIVELRKLRFVMPDCLAGRWAADYFHATNASDSTEYIKYSTEYASAASLEKKPMAQRISEHREFMKEFGGFEPLSAVKMNDREVYVLVRDLNSRAGWVFRFKMEENDKKGRKEAALSGPHSPYLNERQLLEVVHGDW